MGREERPSPLVEIGRACTADYQDILRIQRANAPDQIPDVEKPTRGYVSLMTDTEFLHDIDTAIGITVARVRERVIGYLMPMTINQVREVKLFDSFVAQFPRLKCEGQPLTDLLSAGRVCMLGQVCIAPAFRGKQVIERLYDELCPRLVGRGYTFGISEIGHINAISLDVHERKLGFKRLGFYAADGRHWAVVGLDLRAACKSPFFKSSR